MKLFGFIFFLLFVFSTQIISAQTASQTGNVSPNPNGNKNQTDFEDAEALSTDFRNFKYTDANGKEFQLTKGDYAFLDPKTKTRQNFKFRKVYYFDVTGDGNKDAVVHLFADFCETCEQKSVFYIFSAKNKQLLTVWKIFTGGGEKCGLKDISFTRAAITFGAFGNCSIKDSTVIEDNLLNKTDVFTEFTYHFNDDEYIFNSKENFPFQQSQILTYKTQIKFGS